MGHHRFSLHPRTFNILIHLIVVLLHFVVPPNEATYIDNLAYEQLAPILDTSPALLIFTAQWCEHSAALTPEIDVLASAARETSFVTIARVDAEKEPALPARFSVNAFPTVLFFERSFPLTNKSRQPIEFLDYRWAEVIAEFVNNHSSDPILHVPPRPAFLLWRESNPYNLGGQAANHKDMQIDTSAKDSFDDLGTRIIREPLALTADNLDLLANIVHQTRTLVLFFSQHDSRIQELKLQWRQASSAFTAADNVTIAIVDISHETSAVLRGRFGIESTPHCLYFPRQDKNDFTSYRIDSRQCSGELDHTENIIQFLSDRVVEELGLAPTNENIQTENTYRLTEEQYQKMKHSGVTFANDIEHQDRMKAIYEQVTRSKETFLRESKEEL